MEFLKLLAAGAGWLIVIGAFLALVLIAVWPYMEALMNRKGKK